MRIWLAIQAFFKTLSDREFAAGVEQLRLGGPSATAEPAATQPAATQSAATQPPAPKPPARSEAVTLLAALQREARLVDLVCESLDGYSDAQVGAAARDVLKDSRKVLERMFALESLAPVAEGESLEVPAGYDAAEFRLTGNVSAQPPVTGQLVHAGWKATKCEVPTWTGSEATARVVAPAEVQVR